jgi:hypothetical protein
MCRFALVLLPLLAACAAPPQEAPAPGLPNPAALFCVKSGGSVIPRETAEGTQGWCRLPSGLVVEEWDFYRQSRG